MKIGNNRVTEASGDHPAFSGMTGMHANTGRILIVGNTGPDENAVRSALEVIEHQSFEFTQVGTATEALCQLGSGEFDIAFIGRTAEGADGAAIIRRAGGRLSPTPMVYISDARLSDGIDVDIPGGATDMVLTDEISPWLLRRVIRYARSSHATARRLIVDEYRSREIAEDASEANVQKTQFLALMSHEFRTPLNAILGFSEAIGQEIFGRLDGVGAAKYREYVGHIHSSGAHLLGLINDLLDLSKIEAGKQTIDPVMTPLRDVLDDVVRMVTPQAEAGGVGVTFEAPDVSAIDVYADRRLLTQAVLNVIANAVKFSPSGGVVTVGAVLEGRNVVIAVSDQGCGIPKSELALVLEPFHQVEGLETRPGRGTGLGLPLSQSIMALHQGGLEIASEEGRGTTVSIWLPCDTNSAESKAA